MKPIIGIDLGTTNSEVAALIDGQVQIISAGYTKMLPSCVGLAPDGTLLIGQTAKNQQLLYPERTVRSIKRKMGSNEVVSLGDRTFTPQEISSLILRELANWAEKRLGEKPEKAVITVPAYFSDAQRQATREAGQLANLEVVRIVNEPTAASLAYNCAEKTGNILVYDLGGGTFDVSVVHDEAGVTEVLASHGNNHLGGDDFTELLFEQLLQTIRDEHQVTLGDKEDKARAQLWWAAETAKRELSQDSYVQIREENLVLSSGDTIHLDVEISRNEYEGLIRPLLESTMDSVTRTMTDAHVTANDLDAILLVGGSSRTPLIQQLLLERSQAPIHQEIHPDLCVALGAGVLGARLSGNDIQRTLVDITAYSFGISYLGDRAGAMYPHCYKPIIHRNTALPITRTESYSTSSPEQTRAIINVFQGENSDALRNIPLGEFWIEGLTPKTGPNEILCRMQIDVDGILHVSAIEKDTGLTKKITIENALQPMTEAEIQRARKSLETLYDTREELASPTDDAEIADSTDGLPEQVAVAAQEDPATDTNDDDGPWWQAKKEAAQLLERSRSLIEKMHADDREEAIDLHEQIQQAMRGQDAESLAQAVDELKEIVFFVETQ